MQIPADGVLIVACPLTALVQVSLSRPGEEAPLQEAVEQLGQMDGIAAALCDRLVDELREAASSPLVATGPAIFVAAALANEEAYWIALCLQVRIWLASVASPKNARFVVSRSLSTSSETGFP